MTTNDRLKRVEQQIASLTRGVEQTLRSQADFVDGVGGELLAKAYGGGATGDTKKLNALEARVTKMERTVEAVYSYLTDAPQPHQTSAGEQAALDTLAKAQSAVKRRMTPEGILERAEKVLTDPDAMGVVASYVSMGKLAKAADLLADAEARVGKSDEDDAHGRVEAQMKEHELLANVSQLGEQVADLQHTLNTLLSRISKLEARPQAAAPAPAQTIAKGGQFGRRQVQEPDAANTAQGLQERLEAVFDSPAQVGTLSSMLQAGRVDEVRRAVEQAEVRHQAQMTKRDRRTL